MDTHHVLSLFGKEYSLLKRILIDTIQKYNSAFLAFGALAEKIRLREIVENEMNLRVNRV